MGMTCLIIAAGKGTRLAARGECKPLVRVAGTALIERVIRLVSTAGIKKIVVVTGFEAERVEAFLERLQTVLPVHIECIRNRQWDRENGLSVHSAKQKIKGPFFLLMSDHIFAASILSDLGDHTLERDGLLLAVDRNTRNHPFADIDDVTKVETDDDKIVAIGKTLPRYDAFDTGIFRCTPSLFAALEESMKGGNDSLSGGVSILAASRKASVMDIGGRFWVDVDDEKALVKTETYLRKHERKKRSHPTPKGPAFRG